jgi:hypothetical protein
MNLASPASNMRRILYNLFTSLVPHPLHRADGQFTHLNSWNAVHDYYFMMSQTTLLLMIGLGGGVAVAILLFRSLLRPRPAPVPNRGFWLFFILFTYVVGIAVNYDWDPYGCAHVTLQSLALIGVSFLAARLMELGPGLFRLVLAGLAIDYALGIFLHFDVQSRLLPTVVGPGGRVSLVVDPTRGATVYANYLDKLQAHLVFWADHLAGLLPELQIISAVTALLALWHLLRLARAARRTFPSIAR